MKKLFNLLVLFFLVACNSEAQEQKVKSKSPKNIILMIGDGMGLTQIQAAMTVNENYLNFEKFQTIGLSKTSSADEYITDSAAGATAFSTGIKTYNLAIAVDSDTIPQKTILEYAEDAGLSTGLVATSAITHATPASFIAHQPWRVMGEEIASDFLKTDIDVFIGGGKDHFTNRKDGVDLTDSLKAKGYQVTFELDGLKDIHSGKIAALLSADGMPPYSKGRGEMLKPSALKALEILSQNEAGFFLMVEGSQIDWGGHKNSPEYMVSELLDFDNVIGEVLDFAEKDGNTLIIITADHETGGLTILEEGIVTDSTATNFSTDHHTPVMVPVFAKGPGEEEFGGIYENTEIYFKMMNALGLKPPE
jgi:alkaline phosphatase